MLIRSMSKRSKGWWSMGTRQSGSQEQERVLDAYIKLRRAVNTINACEAEVMRSAGLTESQFGVLEALLHLGPLCQKDLAAKILKSTGNLTTVVDNLERRGLVQRRRSAEDRRVVTVRLTDEGRRLIDSVFPRHVTALVDAFAVLTADELHQLATLCRKLGKQEGE
jgi:MarR family 2-MHQ and catechol resistance regulon transcriptional repressor